MASEIPALDRQAIFDDVAPYVGLSSEELDAMRHGLCRLAAEQWASWPQAAKDRSRSHQSLLRSGSASSPHSVAMAAQADELARRLADVLEARGLTHAIGSSIALAAWGYARATVDVDLDVFVGLDELDPVFEALIAAGCTLDPDSCRASATERGDFRATLEGMRVDVFVPSIPLYASARTRIRRGALVGRPAWFLSAEDLITFKMLFFRTKDLLDAERLLAVRADFDRDYVRRWLVDLVGPGDARISKWDAMTRSIPVPRKD